MTDKMKVDTTNLETTATDFTKLANTSIASSAILHAKAAVLELKSDMVQTEVSKIFVG